MSILQSQVRRAHRRLGFNVLLERFAIALIATSGAWALVVLAERLFAFGLPVNIVNYAALGVLTAITLIGASLHRVSVLAAAVELDKAASLKERMSSALAIDARQAQSDPFAAALMRDAEALAGKVHVPQAVPLRAPTLWPWSAATVTTAALLFFFMPQFHLFAPEAKAAEAGVDPRVAKKDSEKIASAVNQKLERMREFTKDKPELANLTDAIKPLEMPEKGVVKPEDVQRDAVKVLDQLADKLEEKRGDEKFKALDQLKQMLPQLNRQKAENPAAKLADALANADFKQANDEMKSLQKDLSDASKAGTPEAQEKMQKLQESMQKLSEDLKKLNNDDKLQKDLQNKAGLSEQDAKKLLNEVSKMDPKDIAKELQKRLGDKPNMTPEALKDLAQKMMQDAEAKKQLQQMAQKMAQAADAMKELQQSQNQGQKGEQAKQSKDGQQSQDGKQDQQGKQGEKGQQSAQKGDGQQKSDQGQSDAEKAANEAAQAMSEAGQQMSDMEMSEQMMNEMEAQMSELDDLRKQMNGEGEDKDGKGGNQDETEPQKQDGNGQSNDYGRGYGAHIGKDRQAHKLKVERVKAPMQKGQIIGQMLFDGPQVKGEATAEVREAVNSAVRDATDAINRDQVPRQYERAVREYFDGLAGLIGEGAAPAPGEQHPSESGANKPAVPTPAPPAPGGAK